ncbi:MAG: copper resistance system multicopper oxidase, partial [Woeseia sp.]
MPRNPEISRRQFTRLAGAAVATLMLPTPGWARSNRAADGDGRWPGHYDLTIGTTSVSFGGRRATATGINGTVPGPLLRFREGERVTLDVLNTLSEDSSLHWHGLLLPAGMDGVPGISFAGIPPGERFRYEYDVVQNGTYWYHSHSGLQEQSGVYGPIIIDPAGRDPVEYDSEFVVLLSDWTFEDPWTVFANLKKAGDHYNRQKRTVFDFFRDAAQSGFSEARAERAMWGRMRMEPTDIADVTGATYTYLMNGSDPAANWTACFRPGERVRLRVINGSAMSFFNVRIPGLEMEVVQADGQNVKPLTVDEFQIAVAETYDVVVQPKDDRAYTIFAESMDRSGFARGTLAPRPGMTAELPRLREPPRLTMEDMGMAHAAAGAGDAVAEHSHMHQSAPGHSPHTAAVQDQRSAAITRHEHVMGPGVAGVSATAVSRLDHPGTGLENAGHRVLRYRDL